MRASFALASAVLALLSTASVAADPGPQVDPAPVAARLRPIDELLSSLPIPNGYMRVRASDVAIDRQTLHLIRYERADDRNSDLGGEHVSVLVDRLGRLRGFTRMDLALRDGELPRPDEAETIARAFLARHAPDLAAADLVLAGVTPHERILKADDEEPVPIGGMKVKMQNGQDGRWLWVTVGTDRDVVSFERDVVWSGESGGPTSDRWLDDNWLGRALDRLGGRGA